MDSGGLPVHLTGVGDSTPGDIVAQLLEVHLWFSAHLSLIQFLLLFVSLALVSSSDGQDSGLTTALMFAVIGLVDCCPYSLELHAVARYS